MFIFTIGIIIQLYNFFKKSIISGKKRKRKEGEGEKKRERKMEERERERGKERGGGISE